MDYDARPQLLRAARHVSCTRVRPEVDMQDKYAFDIGDYGKFGLLRQLIGDTHLALGVLWWKTNVGSSGADGKHVGYLTNDGYGAPDATLWTEMRQRFLSGERRIESLEPLLPGGTVFHRTPVPPNGSRPAWFQGALEHVKAAHVVFCDPDNGVLLVNNCASVQHISLGEIRSLCKGGHSLVIYHHLNRSDSHKSQIAGMLRRLRHELPDAEAVYGAWFHRGSGRVFLVVAQRAHASTIHAAIECLQASAWTHDGHFTIVRVDENADTPTDDGDPDGSIDLVEILRTRQESKPEEDFSLEGRAPTVDSQPSTPAVVQHSTESRTKTQQRCKHGLDVRFCSLCAGHSPNPGGRRVARANLPEILQFLNEEEIRARYGAVAEVLGVIARNMGTLLGTRRPYASWVVGRDGWPTGYSADELHPRLFRRAEIIDSGATLLRRLGEWRERKAVAAGFAGVTL